MARLSEKRAVERAEKADGASRRNPCPFGIGGTPARGRKEEKAQAGRASEKVRGRGWEGEEGGILLLT